MFAIRQLFRASVHDTHSNWFKHLSTVSTVDDKPYPLDGIRVLDLTRIGKYIYFQGKFMNLKLEMHSQHIS